MHKVIPRFALPLMLLVALQAGCADPVAGPRHVERVDGRPSSPPIANQPHFNRTTSGSDLVTLTWFYGTDANVSNPTFEIEVSYAGYTSQSSTISTNNTYGCWGYGRSSGQPQAECNMNVATINARPRIGAPTPEVLRVEVCQKGVFWCTYVGTGYIGADRSGTLFEITNGQSSAFMILQWRSVEYNVASVAIDRTSLFLSSGTVAFATLTAFDRFGEAIPGHLVSWSSSNPSVAAVGEYGQVAGDRPGTATITGSVSGHQAQFGTTVVNDLNVQISGPTLVKSSSSCTWGVDIVSSNATYPLSYSWYRDYSSTSSSSDMFYTSSVGPEYSSFDLAVRVEDATGRVGWSTRTITSSQAGSDCYQQQSAPAPLDP